MASKRSRILLFTVIIWLVFLLSIEVFARLAYFVANDFNPYFLTYGFVADTSFHSAEENGYSKFQADTIYHYKGETDIPNRINADGFRGLVDFERPKPEGTIRVTCLGASSTFGYGDEDDETYPYMLQEKLRVSNPGEEIEVFNLGIPHLRLSNILNLARHELPSLEPDVVTLYTAWNNAVLSGDREDANLLYKIKDALVFNSVAYKTVHHIVKAAYYRIAGALDRDIAGMPNLSVPVMLSQEEIATRVAAGRAEYRSDLESLAALVDELDAQLVLMTQSISMFGWHDSVSEFGPYQNELATVHADLERDGGLLAPRVAILLHEAFMEELRGFAAERGLPLVDGLSLLEREDRSPLMLSFVHLTPEGNDILSDGMAEVFEREGVVAH